MKKKLFFISAITLLSIFKVAAQNNVSNQAKNDPMAALEDHENAAAEKHQENLGVLISSILFKVKNSDANDSDSDIMPWASIENAKEDLPNLYQKEEVVIKATSINIIIDYPLTKPYIFTMKSTNGFTRQQLLAAISEHYFKVYQEEENTATIKTIPMEKRTQMANRNETNGRYGIWGHDISDLDLSEIQVYKTTDNQIIVSLRIES